MTDYVAGIDSGIDWAGVREFSYWLDEQVSQVYLDQPLAQDWARIAKLAEETGEAIAELISWTGQNPRKGDDPAAYSRMLTELADAVFTGIYALQHFTGDISETRMVLAAAQAKHMTRMRETQAQAAGGTGYAQESLLAAQDGPSGSPS